MLRIWPSSWSIINLPWEQLKMFGFDHFYFYLFLFVLPHSLCYIDLQVHTRFLVLKTQISVLSLCRLGTFSLDRLK